MTTSSGGSASRATPGSITRRGPAHCTGKARALNTGSVSTLRPLIWSSTVECPIQVAVKSSGPARGYEIACVAVGKKPRRGDAGGRRERRSLAHRRRAPSPCGSLCGQGLRNRPSGPTWAERCCAIVVIPKENPGVTRLGTACLPDTFRLVSRSALVALVIANAFVAFQTLRHEWGFCNPSRAPEQPSA